MTSHKTVERLPGRCAHCGGTFLVLNGENKCVMCSRTILDRVDKQRYYEFNKLAIMADCKLIGRTPAQRKWKIPQGSITKLIRRWSNNGTPEPAPALLVNPPEKDLVSELAEARIEIATLRGYQQACRELMQGKK